jgi:hypothetical protein
VLRKNSSRDAFEVVTVQAAETRVGNDAMSGVCDVRSVPVGASDHEEVQGPTQNVVAHRGNETSTPQELSTDAVR